MPVDDLMHKAGRKMGAEIPGNDIFFARFLGWQSLVYFSAA